MQIDLLTNIFANQQAFQQSLGVIPFKDDKKKQEFINEQVLAATDELHEALKETKWKSWKKKQTFNKKAFKEELVDAFIVLTNLALAADLTPSELFNQYHYKLRENVTRQENGY